MFLTIFKSLLENISLYLVEQCFCHLLYILDRHGLLLQRIAAHHLDSSVFEITATHNQTYRYSL